MSLISFKNNLDSNFYYNINNQIQNFIRTNNDNKDTFICSVLSEPLQHGQTERYYNIDSHYTCYAREDFPWCAFGQYLKTKFQDNDKVSIYQYGSSTGEETYTLKMLLENVFKDKAEKFYPIIAKDIDKEIISTNKLQQQIGKIISTKDIDSLIKRLRINIDDNIKNYFTIKPLFKNSSAFIPIIINQNITKNIKFENANILNDIDSIDSNNPSIIFCSDY